MDSEPRSITVQQALDEVVEKYEHSLDKLLEHQISFLQERAEDAKQKVIAEIDRMHALYPHAADQ